MNKTFCTLNFISFLLLLFLTVSWASDFETMSNKELFEMRGIMKFAVEEQKKAYLDEWEKRVENMSEEEKKKYTEAPAKDGQGDQLWVPGRGYERQVNQGQIIFGGSPSGKKDIPKK